MAKYTTQLRHIRENGFDLDLKSYPIFDEAYREGLNKRILDHYHMYEIGLETAGLFKFHLNARMNEIMPYYNQLYKSELIVFDPMHSLDYNETYTKKTTGTSDTDTKLDSNGSSTSHLEDNGKGSKTGSENSKLDYSERENNLLNQEHIHSDTPQGLLTIGNINGNVYASQADINEDTTNSTRSHDENRSGDNSENTTSENTTDGTASTTDTTTGETITKLESLDDYARHVVGNNGVRNYSQLILDFRNTFLAIDMMVIDELIGKTHIPNVESRGSLFMLLW